MYTNTLNVLSVVNFWIILALLGVNVSESTFDHDHILCRKCGNELTENLLENFINITSPQSESINRISLFGHNHLVVQSLRNPADVVFYMVTVKVSGCKGIGEWYSEHTWFPGYSWKVCICPRCRAHLGWVFELTKKIQSGYVTSKSSGEGFYGLIVDSLISEDFSESLVITLPKTLRI
ncbi:uncharacterized protein LOC135217648 isoform X2 [Macrobrachium nipponense]|uniref:uncharacterized protein LOC135217648 isoform X2 n=2 Tax=Macrobrachium nipponense TaxID=159736 RepID=UPI0030C7F6E8